MITFSRTLMATTGAALLALGAGGAANAQPWDRGYDRGFGHGEMRGGGGERFAVDLCRRAATDAAMRQGGNARVTDIGDIAPTFNGFRMKGEVTVMRGDRHRGGYRQANFSCRTNGSRVAALSFGPGWR